MTGRARTRRLRRSRPPARCPGRSRRVSCRPSCRRKLKTRTMNRPSGAASVPPEVTSRRRRRPTGELDTIVAAGRSGPASSRWRRTLTGARRSRPGGGALVGTSPLPAPRVPRRRRVGPTRPSRSVRVHGGRRRTPVPTGHAAPWAVRIPLPDRLRMDSRSESSAEGSVLSGRRRRVANSADVWPARPKR